MSRQLFNPASQPRQPLLITGANGTLGKAFARVCQIRGIEAVALTRQDMDIADLGSIERALERYNPWAVINTAGYVRVDDAETDAERCFRENSTGPAMLATVCAAHGVQLLTFSSDLVFDGYKTDPYVESDKARPLNVYGQSKQRAEREVLKRMKGALVVRTSAFFGPWDEYNFVHFVLRSAREGTAFEAADDVQIAPTYVPCLANTALDLLIDDERGIWHLANQGSCSWAELARMAAEQAGFSSDFVVGRPMGSFNLQAARPLQSVLSSEQGVMLPPLEASLRQYLLDIGHSPSHDLGLLSAGCSSKGTKVPG
ncbi:SDR family oxidoreductase [Hymenobacter latericus]|uniref:SDR family oxidoreductase n=1 Tax=Hymenobacter sp. YIM 151858-1 TaxID=2987688 RepID=UPI00222748D9|nr:SDR family oxidoreductase [Hymenobacter sp. YIM 151858-1]UYZ58943.1 SDR family oxidoreductase [Hymenobacter sp. YIM 151858-1]